MLEEMDVDMDESAIAKDRMDERATATLLQAGKKSADGLQSLKDQRSQQSSKNMPDKIISYVDEHNMN